MDWLSVDGVRPGCTELNRSFTGKSAAENGVYLVLHGFG